MSRKPAAEQPTPPEVPAEVPVKPILKSQAMDAAIAAGMASPAEGVAYVSEHFGIEVSAKQFSTHKSLAKQKASIDARMTTPLASVKPAANPATRPPAPAPEETPRSQPELADAVQAIKGLVEALGVEQVQRIAGLFRD